MAFASSLSSPPEILFFLLLFTPIPLFPSHFCPSHFFLFFPLPIFQLLIFLLIFLSPPLFSVFPLLLLLLFLCFWLWIAVFFWWVSFGSIISFSYLYCLFHFPFLLCTAYLLCSACPIVLNAFRPPLPVPPLPPSLHFFLPWLPLEFFRSSFFSFWCSSFSFPL